MSLDVKENFKLSGVTRFGIGGPADFFVAIKDAKELQEAFAWAKAKSLAVYVMGEGTNLLVSDEGFRGLVIQVSCVQIEWDIEKLLATVGAGVNLLEFISLACARGFAGMENMYGIPGSIGGGIYGNVGAYGTEIKDVITSVIIWDGEAIKTFSNSDCQFEYRASIFKQHKDWVILEAGFQFKQGVDADLITRCQDVMATRSVKYPEGMKCPGSYFKNVKLDLLNTDQLAAIQPYQDKVKGGKLASGLLLEAAGANGLNVGDAKVAEYHGNLIYNDGQASAKDVLALASKVKQLVQDKFGIQLEEEVQYLE